jgi:hypothetical protein
MGEADGENGLEFGGRRPVEIDDGLVGTERG